MKRQIHHCPVCNSQLEITEYQCPDCHTTIRGNFHASVLSTLTAPQQEFIVIFMCCKGNIKEVERTLNISYPTVRNKLNEIAQKLCSHATTHQNNKQEILSALEQGNISVSDAITKLKQGG